MFGNNPLSTVMYGTDKIYGQGYDPLDPNNEVKIYIPGDTMDGDLVDLSGGIQGDGSDGQLSYSGDSWESGDID